MDIADYLTPENYEIEEWSRPDEMAMFIAFWTEAQIVLDSLGNAKVADICCGTGMSMLGVVSHPSVSTFKGVDIDQKNIDFARQRFGAFEKSSFECADAQAWLKCNDGFDLLLLCSGYHHIEHVGQRTFAKTLAQALKPGGYAVFGENIVADFSGPLSADYNNAVREFYSFVSADAKSQRPDIPRYILELIDENVTLALKGEVEFKVCDQHFQDELSSAGLRLFKKAKAWPLDRDLPGDAGNYIYVFQKLL